MYSSSSRPVNTLLELIFKGDEESLTNEASACLYFTYRGAHTHLCEGAEEAQCAAHQTYSIIIITPPQFEQVTHVNQPVFWLL